MDKFCVHHPRKVEKTVVLKNVFANHQLKWSNFSKEAFIQDSSRVLLVTAAIISLHEHVVVIFESFI